MTAPSEIRPLTLLGATGAVCEGDDCVVPSSSGTDSSPGFTEAS